MSMNISAYSIYLISIKVYFTTFLVYSFLLLCVFIIIYIIIRFNRTFHDWKLFVIFSVTRNDILHTKFKNKIKKQKLTEFEKVA